jgi:hypothetical protein
MSDAGDGASTAEDSHVTVLPDVHEPKKYQINAEARPKVVIITMWVAAPQGADHPLPLHVATAGKNHLNEEITPLLPTGIGER